MDKILILDFGGQYNQLIARRVREQQVYCELHHFRMPLEEIRRFDPIGIIFTGGPHSVYLPDAPKPDPGVFTLGVPILGICYGCQLLAQSLGGLVTAAEDASAREYGKTETVFDPTCALFRDLPEMSVTWMSHGDYLARLPEGFAVKLQDIAVKHGGSLKVSDERADVENGFILRYGGIEENCSLRALFSAKQEELQDEVHRSLF